MNIIRTQLLALAVTSALCMPVVALAAEDGPGTHVGVGGTHLDVDAHTDRDAERMHGGDDHPSHDETDVDSEVHAGHPYDGHRDRDGHRMRHHDGDHSWDDNGDGPANSHASERNHSERSQRGKGHKYGLDHD